MTTLTGPAQPQDGPPFRLRSVAVSAYGPTVLEAMGYVAADRAAPGTPLRLEVRGRTVEARVAPLPFVPHRYHTGRAKEQA